MPLSVGGRMHPGDRHQARIMREAPWRDRGDGRATGQPSRGTAGLGPEAYLFRTSQGTSPEDARKDGHIRGRRVRA
jgi:hypothetical protein